MDNVKQTNFGYIKTYGGKVAEQVKSFAKIRSWGDKNSAITFDNVRVERQDFIFVDGYGMVNLTQYELHFLYEDKSKKIGRWSYMCTCGSIGGVVSYKELVGLVSPKLGEYVMVCIAHMASKQNSGIGNHADGSTE